MPPKIKCSWRDADDATMVATLRQCKDDGMQADSGWKPVVWTHVSTALKDSPGPTKTADKCRDHWGNLKALFVEVRELTQLSGFGWDSGLKMATAVDDVWDKLIASNNKKYAKWRKKPFPLYDDILYLVDGIVATGVGAFHAGTANLPRVPSETVPGNDKTATDDEESAAPTAAPAPKTPARARFADDFTPSSPVTGRKRAASSSPQKSPNKSAARRRRTRNADAASDMAGALREMAGSMRVNGSPEIRAAAVQLMEEDGELSDETSVNAMRLFTKEIAVAQTYLGSKKKALRTAYLHGALEDAGFF